MADPNGHRRLPADDPGRGATQFRPDSPPTGFPVEAAYSTFPAYGRARAPAPLFASPFAVGETSGDCGVTGHLDQDQGFVGRNLFAGGDHLGATTPSALGHRWFGTPSAEYMPGPGAFPADDPGRGATQFLPDSPPTGFPVEAAYSTLLAYRRARAPLFAFPFAVGETSGDCGGHLDQDEGFVGRNLSAGGEHLGATTPSALGHRWFRTPSAEYMPEPGAFPAVARTTHRDIWSSEPGNKSSRRHLLRKTKLCGPYMGGYCAVGSLCEYAHGAEEIRKVILHSSAHYKTKLCLTFTRGELCLSSLNCRFAHGKEELRPAPQRRHRTSPAAAAAHAGPCSSSSSPAVAGGAMGSSLIAPCDTRIGYLKTLLCKYDWRRGRCRNGDACDFAHGEEDQRIVPKEAGWCGPRRLCEEIATKGWCVYGLNCNYSHGGAYRRRRSSALGGRRSSSS